MPPAPVRRILALLVLAFAFGGLTFAVATPMFQNPDEPSHLDLVHSYAHDPTHLAGPGLRIRQGTVEAVERVGLRAASGPIAYDEVATSRPRYLSLDDSARADQPATSGCPASCQNYQYAHPPGWYLAMAPLARLVDGMSFASVLFALRAGNVLLALAAVPLTWFAAGQVWPGAVRRPLAAAAAVAFCGPYLATAAAVNNDAAALVLAAATTALMARALRQGSTMSSAALLGSVVAVGLLVKAQFIVIAPLAGLAVLVGPSAIARWRSSLSFAVPTLIGAQWWIATVVRDGSLTPGGSELVTAPASGPWQHERFGAYVLDHLGELHGRLYGLYGWASVQAPDLWRTALTVTTVLVALIWLAARQWRRPRLASLRWWVLAAIPAGLLVASFKASFDVYRLNGEVRGLAPRYLYPAIPVLALGLAAAGGALAGRIPSRLRDLLTGVSVLVLAGIAGAGSLVLAVTGLLDTRSVGRMIDRADVVSPVASPAIWVGILATGWIVVTLIASVGLVRLRVAQRATTPMVLRPSSSQSPASGRQPAAP